MGELANFPNIGKVVESQLHEVGITTVDMLRKHGFQIADTHENIEWGDPVLEERWDLIL